MARTQIKLNQLIQDGATSNQVISWNGSNWAPSTITGDGNGIYSGAGTVPTNTVATITDVLTFRETVAANTGIITPVTIDVRTSNGSGGAASFGAGLLFTAETTTTESREIFGMEASWITATDATRSSSVAFKLPNSGSYATRLTLNSSSLTTAGIFTFGNSTFDVTLGGSSGRSVLSSSGNAADAILLNATGASNSNGITLLGANTYTNTSGSRIGVTTPATFAPTSGTAAWTSQAITTTINQTGGANGITRGLHINPTLTSVADWRGLEISGTFAPTSGSTVATSQLINPTINQTGGASGITRGIYINPTITAAADFRALEIGNTAANTYGVYQGGTSVLNLLAGNTGIGIAPGTDKLRVSGSIRFDLGSDAQGDIFYRNSSGNLTRLPIGANGHVLTSNGTIPGWSASSGGGNGIYGGSGTIASAAVATVTSGSTFTIDYNDGVDALVIDDANGNLSINAKSSNSGTLQVKAEGVALGGAATDGLVYVDQASFALTAVDTYTPATNQNNYAIADGTSIVRINGSQNIEITGISQTTSTSGRILTIHNVSSLYTVTLKNQSASSTAANRISLGSNELSDVVLRPQQSYTLIYDGTSSRWRSLVSPIIPVSVQLTAALPTNTTAHGITTTFTANENQGFGDIVFINTDGEAQLADADSASTTPVVAMCISSSVTANNVGDYLFYGIARNDTWNWTVGGYVYLSTTGTTGNTLTQSAPSGSGDIVQLVGIATHPDRILFKPDLTTIEI